MRRQVRRGFLAAPEAVPPLVVVFAFNPDSVHDDKDVAYADRDDDLRGIAPGKVYTGGGHRTIAFDLQLHGLESDPATDTTAPVTPGISAELATLRSFLYPRTGPGESAAPPRRPGEGRRLTSPPRCIFGYGRKVLDCVVTSLTINETQFNASLDPVRAEVSVALTAVEDEGNWLYELDRQRRHATVARGLRDLPGVMG